VETLLDSLRNLEYRGYDSAGIAARSDRGMQIRKDSGEVEELCRTVEGTDFGATAGIAHTRWSTHGPPTRANAHPHDDCTGRVAVVHNGIIDNYDSLRAELRADGHEFQSETDTEVIPHLISANLDEGLSPAAAFRRAFDRISGSYAVAAVFAEEDAIYATRNGSPLVLGIGSDGYYLASDVPAFVQHTNRVAFLRDGDVVRITPDGYEITGKGGDAVDRPLETIEWDPEDAEKAGYDHYMAKEIQEQPTTLRRAVEGRTAGGDDPIELEEFPPGSFAGVREVHLVGMGTSYHAAKYVEALLMDWGVNARACLAGKYAHTHPPIDGRTLFVAVTQSGETADTLNATETAVANGARTLALTNVVGSSITRECDDSLFIRAGPEIGVAATKTFSSQVATLLLLAQRLAADVTGSYSPDAPALLRSLRELPDGVERLLRTTRIEQVASRFRDSDAYFFIGRGLAHAVALEGALKFKEISYEHAEGFPASQLKHGPLALVTESTPVFAVLTGRNDDTTLSNIKEVQARGAPVVAVTDGTNGSVVDQVAEVVEIPETHPAVAGVLANVQLQLLAYHAAELIGRPIDKPRNLAKSVTVE